MAMVDDVRLVTIVRPMVVEQIAAEETEGHRKASSLAKTYDLQRLTGWHYHKHDLQLAFLLGGSIDIAYADEEWERYHGGEILVIPDHAPHNAARATPDYGLVELTFPGNFGTVECPAPAGGMASDGFVLSDEQVMPGVDGVFNFVLAPHVARVGDIRLIKTGNGAAKLPARRAGMAITLITNGHCIAAAEGESNTSTTSTRMPAASPTGATSTWRLATISAAARARSMPGTCCFALASQPMMWRGTRPRCDN